MKPIGGGVWPFRASSYVNSTVVREKELLDVQCHTGTAEVQVVRWYILKSDYMTLWPLNPDWDSMFEIPWQEKKTTTTNFFCSKQPVMQENFREGWTDPKKFNNKSWKHFHQISLAFLCFKAVTHQVSHRSMSGHCWASVSSVFAPLALVRLRCWLFVQLSCSA